MTSDSSPHPDRPVTVPRDRAISTLLGLLLPLAILGSASVLALSWREDLPDPVATHWGGDGVDGTGSLTGLVTLVGLIGTACIVGGWAVAYFLGRDAVVRRFGVGFSLGLGTFLAGVLVGTLAIQRGIPAALDAPDVGWALLVSFVLACAAGTMGAVAIRRDPPLPVTAAVPMPTMGTIPASVDGPWERRVVSPPLRRVGVIAGSAVCVVGVLAGAGIFIVPLGIALGGVVVAFSSFRVVVDARGLTVIWAFGWPQFAVPLDEVLSAHEVSVNPLRDFGGWGYRVGREGRVGIVARTGQAIEVERTGGRFAVVTVDDAAEGAATLQVLAARASRRAFPDQTP